MKKKLFAALSAALLASLFLGLFTACGSNSGGNDKNDTNGDAPTIEEVISNHEHKYDSREICTVCGYTENSTEGLEYGYSEEGSYYYVRGLGTAMETDIIIPSVYNDGKHGKQLVDKIYHDALKDNPSLTSVVIGYGVTSIEKNAFASCGGLTSITIPNSVIKICDNAFYACSGLSGITIPNSVTSLGFEAFAECSGLTSITIPNSVTKICDYAFYYCSELTSITIEKGVTSIGDYVFRGCGKLTSITHNGTTAEWNAINKTNRWSYGTNDFTIHCKDGDISKENS